MKKAHPEYRFVGEAPERRDGVVKAFLKKVVAFIDTLLMIIGVIGILAIFAILIGKLLPW